jgi:hypothetical protein
MSGMAIRADAVFAYAFQAVLKAASVWLIVGPAMSFAATGFAGADRRPFGRISRFDLFRVKKLRLACQ